MIASKSQALAKLHKSGQLAAYHLAPSLVLLLVEAGLAEYIPVKGKYSMLSITHAGRAELRKLEAGISIEDTDD